MTPACQQGGVEQVYIIIKFRYSILLDMSNTVKVLLFVGTNFRDFRGSTDPGIQEPNEKFYLRSQIMNHSSQPACQSLLTTFQRPNNNVQMEMNMMSNILQNKTV
jgi:hypothetical protein